MARHSKRCSVCQQFVPADQKPWSVDSKLYCGGDVCIADYSSPCLGEQIWGPDWETDVALTEEEREVLGSSY